MRRAIALLCTVTGLAVVSACGGSPTSAPPPSPAPTTALPPTSAVPTPPPTSAPAASSRPPTARLRIVDGVALPDVAATPGETDPGVTSAQICAHGYAQAHNTITSIRYYQVGQRYGLLVSPKTVYHLDRLIPVVLGGDDGVRNLWPQPDPPNARGFTSKNVLEGQLHKLVCSGQVSLATAQQAIATNWLAAYQRYVGP